jgi:hypothetical protein
MLRPLCQVERTQEQGKQLRQALESAEPVVGEADREAMKRVHDLDDAIAR